MSWFSIRIIWRNYFWPYKCNRFLENLQLRIMTRIFPAIFQSFVLANQCCVKKKKKKKKKWEITSQLLNWRIYCKATAATAAATGSSATQLAASLSRPALPPAGRRMIRICKLVYLYTARVCQLTYFRSCIMLMSSTSYTKKMII